MNEALTAIGLVDTLRDRGASKIRIKGFDRCCDTIQELEVEFFAPPVPQLPKPHLTESSRSPQELLDEDEDKTLFHSA